MLATPLHPLLVHFPIALLFIGTITEIIALFKKEFFNKASLYLIGIGWITGVFAYLSGEGAEEYAERYLHSDVHSLVEVHETFALITLVAFGGYLVLKLWSLWKGSPKPFSYLIILVALAGVVTLSVTGHYGGKMVYPDYQNSNGEVIKDTN
ncbi:DUF2231 domain-containing protein [Pseudalkalibacillus caeni]|uniref:DUF2231 domain-containing protein n=1 Tax=Exobacillus caeni TaxID=2574798 RepID=A0A5R9F327_9BACL|nr:DUF2231 domain-containing protein [Pseudalkalibacillus caeni]TLS35313.1 DUF2231 domain-containing protein [Pseudalkalibacillus caeni]